jgi:hypothetical protein
VTLAPCDAAIVFPPLWYYPYLPHELVSLANLLRSRGIATLAIDANGEGLAHCHALPTLRACGRAVGEPVDDLVEAVGRAHATLRDPRRCFDPDEHAAARRTFVDAWRLVSRAHAPTEIDLLKLRFAGAVEDPAAAVAQATGPTNPFWSYTVESVAPRIVGSGARVVVLLYVHVDQLVPLLGIAIALRRAGWRGRVVVGGSLEDQISFAKLLRRERDPGYAHLAPFIDYAIEYEAEPVLCALAERLLAGLAPDGLPNVVAITEDRITRPAMIDSVDVGTLPPFDIDGHSLEVYPFPGPTVSMIGSRGCYWDRCTFCAISRNQLRYRARDPDSVARDVARLVARHGVRWVVFRDQLIAPAWLRRFAMSLITAGVDVRWTCRMRLERAVDGDLIALAFAAGCRQLWFGLESASERVLAAMDKGITVADAERILAACTQHGMGVHLLCLHGFPGETADEAELTVRFVEERAGLIDSVSFTDFMWFASSPLFVDRERVGLRARPDRDHLLQARFDWRDDHTIQVAHRRHLERHARVERAVPMPLVHVSHVAPFIDHWGIERWRTMRHQMSST